MNLSFLGDALDHWKGSLFESLQQNNILREFAVDAMTSDAGSWTAADWDLFARLLRIHPQQILAHTATLAESRVRYFAEITHSGDLFLDPDTGVATCKVKARQQFVFPSEVVRLLAVQESRILAIYQRIRAKKTRDRLDRVVTAIRQQDNSVTCCSYESGTVAMLFLSCDSNRTRGVQGYFQSVLGRHAAGRIHLW